MRSRTRGVGEERADRGLPAASAAADLAVAFLIGEAARLGARAGRHRDAHARTGAAGAVARVHPQPQVPLRAVIVGFGGLGRRRDSEGSRGRPLRGVLGGLGAQGHGDGIRGAGSAGQRGHEP